MTYKGSHEYQAHFSLLKWVNLCLSALKPTDQQTSGDTRVFFIEEASIFQIELLIC